MTDNLDLRSSRLTDDTSMLSTVNWPDWSSTRRNNAVLSDVLPAGREIEHVMTQDFNNRNDFGKKGGQK